MLTFKFSGADGVMVETDTITSGMTGKTVRLEYTSDWDNRTKTAVFTAGQTTVDVLNVGEEVVIPHEVLQNYGDRLYVGIYGIAEDGTAMPTIYARGPRISKGADPSGDESTKATPPVWAQLQAQIDELKQGGTGGGGSSDSGQNVTSASVKTVLENIMTIIKAADEVTYNQDISDLVAQNDSLIAAMGTAEEPDDGETEVTMSSISATYTGGSVAVGTAVNALTGITVKAHYSNGSSETVTGYTLSGTITEGSNTITVSYGGLTTTFAVTGIAESGGGNTGSEGDAETTTGADVVVTGVKATSDGNGNISVTGLTATSDGNGNITVTRK